MPAANGELLRPIDPYRPAEINGRTVDGHTLSLPTIHPPAHPSRQWVPQPSRVPTRIRESRVVTLRQQSPPPQLTYPTRSSPHRPFQNFTPRQADTAHDVAVSRATVPTDRPPVSDRVIHATTPHGEAELVEQLRWFPKRTR